MKIYHIGAHGAGNAGDIVILDCLRAMFPDATWINRNDHEPFDDGAVEQANRADLVLIGGGGLFLKDTHANDVSGWRWNCSVEMLQRIEKPIVVFGVGYNRFRNQPDFIPAFSSQISAVIQKSAFFGMREKTGGWLMSKYAPGLIDKIDYQPCPAMFCGWFYPEIKHKPSKLVVFAPAFDRPQMRFGDNEREIFNQVRDALEGLERQGYTIAVVAHVGSDQKASSYLNYPLVGLAGKTTEEILTFYSKADLVIGMRLHSLIIPFGLGVPFLGLASHNKITRFLSDIGHLDWGVDVEEPDFGKELLKKARSIDFPARYVEIEQEKQEQWQLTRNNFEKIEKAVERIKV